MALTTWSSHTAVSFYPTVVQAAQASLATVVTDLADALPQMSACKSKTMSLVGGALHHATRQLSVAGGSASDLVAQARSTIEAAREVWLKHDWPSCLLCVQWQVLAK